MPTKTKTKTKVTKLKPIFVKWADHYSTDLGWAGVEETKEFYEKFDGVMQFETLGFLFHEDKHYLRVVLTKAVTGTLGDFNQCSQMIHILKSSILQRKYIKL